jgi:hypothetical protein
MTAGESTLRPHPYPDAFESGRTRRRMTSVSAGERRFGGPGGLAPLPCGGSFFRSRMTIDGEVTKEKPGFWTRRMAFEQVRHGSNIQLLSFSLVYGLSPHSRAFSNAVPAPVSPRRLRDLTSHPRRLPPARMHFTTPTSAFPLALPHQPDSAPLPFRCPIALSSYHPNPTHESSAPRRGLATSGATEPLTVAAGGRPGRARGAPSSPCCWAVLVGARPHGVCPAERPAAIQRSGVVAVVDNPRTPAVASVAGPRPPCGVHPSGSVVRDPAVQPSGVRSPGFIVRDPASGRTVSTRPVSSRLVSTPSVRTRPSRPTPGGGVGTRPVRRGTLPRARVEVPVGGRAVEWLGQGLRRPGRGRGCPGRAWVSGVGGGPGPGWARAAGAALAL